MPMRDAFAFIDRCGTDRDFRFALYDADGPMEFKAAVRGAGFDFSDAEIADAASNRKLKARDEDEAAEVDEFLKWYRSMAGENPTTGAGISCGSSCAACPSGALCRPSGSGRPSGSAS